MRVDGWRVTVLGVSLLVIIPLAVILLSFLTPAGEIWNHLLENVLGGPDAGL